MIEGCDCCSGESDGGIGDALSFVAQGYWHVLAVMAGSERDEPPFAYTTGLTSLGRPELMIYGLPQRISGVVLNTVAERLVAGEDIRNGTSMAAVLADHDVVVIDADDTADMFQTRSLYSTFSAMQVVFPDRRNRFPWQPGYSLDPFVQPLKGAPPR
ncbi:DUF4262 domain-containing protein [Williamsia sp. M5A3_1d]